MTRAKIACVCIFVNPSCKYFTKIQTHPSEKKSNASSDDVIACVCIIVNPSCKYFTPIQAHPSEKKSNASLSDDVIACVCMFVNPSCKYFTSIQTHPSEKKKHRIVVRRCHCRARNPRFFMPIFGQKTGVRARMNEIKSGIPCSVSLRAFVLL
jgi:hypothetical protein